MEGSFVLFSYRSWYNSISFNDETQRCCQNTAGIKDTFQKLVDLPRVVIASSKQPAANSHTKTICLYFIFVFFIRRLALSAAMINAAASIITSFKTNLPAADK